MTEAVVGWLFFKVRRDLEKELGGKSCKLLRQRHGDACLRGTVSSDVME